MLAIDSEVTGMLAIDQAWANFLGNYITGFSQKHRAHKIYLLKNKVGATVSEENGNIFKTKQRKIGTEKNIHCWR